MPVSTSIGSDPILNNRKNAQPFRVRKVYSRVECNLMNKTKERIIDHYIDQVLAKGRRPSSVRGFMKELTLKEGTFYKHFNSLDHLEKTIWQNVFDKTIQTIQEEQEYQSYSVNEKLLAFYFTWIESLKDIREYAAFVIKEEKIYEVYPSCFEQFKQSFGQFSSQLVEEGIATGEIASRMFITDRYSFLLWYQPVTILKFWVKDKSENFADTDALIEKTVNFSFDLMRSNTIDSFFDLAKFHIRHF